MLFPKICSIFAANQLGMIMCEIIGRKKEIAELKRYYESGRAEFVAVYGRRRVGKTFLIDEVFHDDMVFHHTGLSPYDRRRKVTLRDQLQNFYFSLLRHGMEDIAQPKSWMEAFFAASMISSRDAPGFPTAMLFAIESWNSTVSCVT